MTNSTLDQLTFTKNNYGAVEMYLKDYLRKRNINRNQLSKAAAVDYKVLTRYYNAKYIYNVDMDIMSRICYVLHCDLNDIMRYDREAVPDKLD